MNYQCGHSIGRHHETAADGYPICPKCLHAERDKLKAKNKALQAESARLKEELKHPIAEDSCPDCGETIYFYTLGPIRCGCGGAELALMVNTTILEE